MGSMPKNDFTLFYCESHCSGCVLTGSHDDVPEWYQMCGGTGTCNWSWWIKNGSISFDKETGVEVIESPVDFSIRDCGGFEFAYYADSITSEIGDIKLADDSPLRKWFETYYY
jgi:hypothetical protein